MDIASLDVSLAKDTMAWLIKREHTIWSHLNITYLRVKIVERLSGVKKLGQPNLYLDLSS